MDKRKKVRKHKRTKQSKKTLINGQRNLKKKSKKTLTKKK